MQQAWKTEYFRWDKSFRLSKQRDSSFRNFALGNMNFSGRAILPHNATSVIRTVRIFPIQARFHSALKSRKLRCVRNAHRTYPGCRSRCRSVVKAFMPAISRQPAGPYSDRCSLSLSNDSCVSYGLSRTHCALLHP